MSTLCHIVLVQDEEEFLSSVEEYGSSREAVFLGTYGSFRGSVPPVHSTLLLGLNSQEKEKCFRVIYHEFRLKSKAYDRVAHPEERRSFLSEGNLDIQVCNIYVVEIE